MQHTNMQTACVQVESKIRDNFLNQRISIDTKILANTSLELYVTHLQSLLKQSWTNIHDEELHNIVFRLVQQLATVSKQHFPQNYLVRILCSWGNINFQMYRENSSKYHYRGFRYKSTWNR